MVRTDTYIFGLNMSELLVIQYVVRKMNKMVSKRRIEFKVLLIGNNK